MINIDKVTIIQDRTKKKFLRQQKRYLKTIDREIRKIAKKGGSIWEVSTDSKPFFTLAYIDSIIEKYNKLGFETGKYAFMLESYLFIKWSEMEGV